MATANTPAKDAGANDQVTGAHDRVAMLSLKADGTPDQVDPEIIGDKDFALEATRRQFAEQAVSAQDDAERAATIDTGGETVKQDPSIAKLQKAHEKTEEAAQKQAESVVGKLFKD